MENYSTASMAFKGEDVGYLAQVAFIVVGSLEIVVGVAGNCLLLAVLFTSRLLGRRSYHNLFIADLAVADLLAMGYWMVFFVLDLIMGYHPVANMDHCAANGFIVCLCMLVSMMSLVCISLNRFIHVCHSRLYPRIFSKRATVVYGLLIWVTAAIVAAPGFFGFGTYYYKTSTHSCTFNQHLYPKIVAVVSMVSSTLMNGYFNLAIFNFWRRAKQNLQRDLQAPSAGNSQKSFLHRLCPWCQKPFTHDTESNNHEERIAAGETFSENKSKSLTSIVHVVPPIPRREHTDSQGDKDSTFADELDSELNVSPDRKTVKGIIVQAFITSTNGTELEDLIHRPPVEGDKIEHPAEGDENEHSAEGSENEKSAERDENERSTEIDENEQSAGDQNEQSAEIYQTEEIAEKDQNEQSAGRDQNEQPAEGGQNEQPPEGDQNEQSAERDQNGQSAEVDQNDQYAKGDQNEQPPKRDQTEQFAEGGKNEQSAEGDQNKQSAEGDQTEQSPEGYADERSDIKSGVSKDMRGSDRVYNEIAIPSSQSTDSFSKRSDAKKEFPEQTNDSPSVRTVTGPTSAVIGLLRVTEACASSPDVSDFAIISADDAGKAHNEVEEILQTKARPSLRPSTRQPATCRHQTKALFMQNCLCIRRTKRSKSYGQQEKVRARRRQKQRSREHAFVRSLAVLSLLMVISFVPFGISRIFEASSKLSAEVGISITLLLFLNCSVNWIVYGAMNRSFRREYAGFLRRVFRKSVEFVRGVTRTRSTGGHK